MANQKTFNVVIVGGGTAGITVAARLRREAPSVSVAIIEPSDKHYYQPLWTLVGGGVFRVADSVRFEKELIPRGVTWIKDAATGFDPDNNRVLTAGSGEVSYDFLVVCPGIQINWNKIEGLSETLGKNGVCSNYSEKYVETTWEFIRNFKGGKALFTFPNTPIKCAGAPQKIMYLAEHHFRNTGVRDKSEIWFVSAAGAIFGVKKYADALTKVIQSRNINTLFNHNLEKIDGAGKKAYFRNTATGEMMEMAFDMIHVAPPMSAPDFIRESPLANEAGWVDVDKHTTRHTKYPNIFSLGDASSLPTSKTGAAIRKQAPVLVSHLLASMAHRQSSKTYDGYTSCPLVTGYGKLILAEFDYDGKPCETFPFDQGKERYSMYLLKKYGLPAMYWHGMMKGFA